MANDPNDPRDSRQPRDPRDDGDGVRDADGAGDGDDGDGDDAGRGAGPAARRAQRLQRFRALVNDRIARLNVAWIQLEGNVERGVVEELLRELHTLKGEAGLMGYAPIADLAHALEDRIGAILESESPPDPATGDRVLEAFDLISAAVARAPNDPAPEIAEFLRQEARAGAEPPAAAPARAAGAAASDAVPTRLIPERSPADPIHGESVDLTFVRLPERAPTSDGLDAVGSSRAYSVRVNPHQLDRMRDIIGELLLTRTRLAVSASSLQIHRHAPGEEAEAETGYGVGYGGDRDDVLRMIEGQLRDDVVRMSTLVNELDEVTRELRMVSISVLFDRYPRFVRTIARELGRKVQLICRGEAVEVDRDVLEALDEPLLHLVRNAVDHGIETPTARKQAGKSSMGILSLSATVIGDALQVSVTDDGAGIDVERVRDLAIERKVIEPGVAASLTEGDVLQCLFQPRMSTRTHITSFSGRGVGLDVVQKTIRYLGGSVEVSTALGVGTTFTVTVPIRAAITSVLLFRVGAGRYALPTSSLVAIDNSESFHAAETLDGPAIYFHDNLIPLVSLPSILGESIDDAVRRPRTIIARYSGGLVGLTGSYDHVQREAVLKVAGSLLHEEKMISAGLALEDGSVALVLNVDEAYRVARGRPHASPAPESPPRQRTVVVAEDSPIVRGLIADALRTHGLRVIEAIDGQDAYEKLEDNEDVELLVTDVEMPRLTGLELIERVRARGGRRIPAIVVSTRGSDEDKLAAVQVGADAYLVKSDFSREGLWTLVSRFLG